jgi:hypothetical protein
MVSRLSVLVVTLTLAVATLVAIDVQAVPWPY